MPSPHEIEVVIGIASSALFDLHESDKVFREQKEDAYREFQEERLNDPLAPGVAFDFVRRLLSLNDLAKDRSPLIEVVILSRNDPETGARVMESVRHHGLPITRSVFMQGRAPYKFMDAFNMTLFLSADEDDVRAAIARDFFAGQVVGEPGSLSLEDGDDGNSLRIAFDFDGVLADDQAETVYQESKDLDVYKAHEDEHGAEPLSAGPLQPFLAALNKIQEIEDDLKRENESYNRRLHIGIVTARNAPAHVRPITTLKHWGLRVNDIFFLGGWPKADTLKIYGPHIFFDDQTDHVDKTKSVVPSVHIPFGVTNKATGAEASPEVPKT
ncbi:5'-nucleotidase [Aeromicrobium tamlense]|nr:5'-nucleotidase [Aeromicrobium tamlense]